MKVRVSAPSHVHTGNFDIHGGLGRLYGTVGMALEEPRLEVSVEAVDAGVEVRGSPRREAYVEFASTLLSQARSEGCSIGGLRIEVEREIPAHVGLGSTTAIALALGSAVYTLCGLEPLDLERIAVSTGRSLVSALGLYTFKHGGLVVDGGFRPGVKKPPPLLFRVHVPKSVAVVVALPRRPIGEVLRIKAVEDKILAEMPSMDEDMAMWASRLVLMGIMASAAEGDWEAAARHLYTLNRRLGEYWASKQGGVYCCREAEVLIVEMLSAGAWGAMQSSWGPTVYGLVERARVREVMERVKGVLDSMGGGEAWATFVDNRGAVIEVLD